MLRQAFAHCGRFLAAASRRSRGRLSVPVWLAVLSDQLPIIALVGRYPTNKLIGRRLLPGWLAPFLDRPTGNRAYAELPTVSDGYPPPRGRLPTCYAPVRHVSARRRPVRLACIRHAASVDPEPGSNSPPLAAEATLSAFCVVPESTTDVATIIRRSIRYCSVFGARSSRLAP